MNFRNQAIKKLNTCPYAALATGRALAAARRRYPYGTNILTAHRGQSGHVTSRHVKPSCVPFIRFVPCCFVRAIVVAPIVVELLLPPSC